jgi:hypothetical protein
MLRLQHKREHTTTKAMNASAASRTLFRVAARVSHSLLQRRPAIVAQVKGCPLRREARLTAETRTRLADQPATEIGSAASVEKRPVRSVRKSVNWRSERTEGLPTQGSP